MIRLRAKMARAVRTHEIYTLAEFANVTGTSRGTVRNWIKKGMPHVVGSRPIHIPGRMAKPWLLSKIAARKQPCKLDEIYCFSCKAPRQPTAMKADLTLNDAEEPILRATCSVCASPLFKRVAADGIADVMGVLTVQDQRAKRTLSGTGQSPSN